MMMASEFLEQPLQASRVTVEDGQILLLTVAGGYQYPVDLDRAATPEAILRWVAHLAEKNWVDSRLLGDFVIIACNQIGVSPYDM